MMLSDEERKQIADSMGINGYSWLDSYAEKIERAVLAKASQQMQDEPVQSNEDNAIMDCFLDEFSAEYQSIDNRLKKGIDLEKCQEGDHLMPDTGFRDSQFKKILMEYFFKGANFAKSLPSPKQMQGELITGENYDAGLWSRRNAEAMVEDGNVINAMSAPKQEPVHWRAVLSDGDREKNPVVSRHVVGFSQLSAAEEWVAAERDFRGWSYTIEPLYTRPAPPQAAAIPEGFCIDPKLKRLALDYVRCGIGANYSRESFENKMDEIYWPFRKIIDLIPLSAATKPGGE